MDEKKQKTEKEWLRKEIEELKHKLKEYLSGWQRAKADYLNREREIEREKSEWIQFAKLDLIVKLLPIHEHLEISLKHLPEEMKENEWAKGVLKIKEQLTHLLKEEGVEKIKTVGEKFNPICHEAVGKQQTIDNEQQTTENVITEEVSPGYKIDGRVIKVAKVIIK